jgi:hypothetical protein
MKRISILTVSLVLFIGGCDLKRILFWSPDGQRAAVIATDGLHLCDASGKLSGVIAADVSLVAWFSNSRRFVAVRTEKIGTWQEAQSLMSTERREELIGLSDRLRAEALAYTGNWDEFKPSMENELTGGELAALVLYVREHRREGLPEKLGDKKWKELEELKGEANVLQVYEVSGETATAGQVLTRTVDPIFEVRISPNDKAIACAQSLSTSEKKMIFSLSVVPAAGGVLQKVAVPVAAYPDWTPDGMSLVYATTKIESPNLDAVQLGTITIQQVLDGAGSLKLEPAQDVIGGLFWPMIKIRCLRDGQILFTGMETTLPAATAEMPQHVALFSFEPERRATVARVLPRDSATQLDEGLPFGSFEISPDQKRMVVCGKDKQIVVTLATGEVVDAVQSQDASSKAMAAWRTADELAVVVPPNTKWGSPGRFEYALWSGPDKAKCLSCGWPKLFEDQKAAPASSPTSRAAGKN